MPFTLSPVAETGPTFRDFAPYVPAIADGHVVFQATLADGRSRIFGSTGPFDSTDDVVSHPAINRHGSVTWFSAADGLVLHRDGRRTVLAALRGELGPTIDDAHAVAFRADLGSGISGVFLANPSLVPIADTRGDLRVFHGLPLLAPDGRVVFRADRRDGRQGIYAGSGGALTTLVETGDGGLGAFPSMNRRGTLVFVDRQGVFTPAGHPLVDPAPFSSFRGALVDDDDHIVFYATPRGGTLGVYVGTERLLGLGDPAFGSVIVDFALNPVSIDARGRIAVRLRLADQRQLVVRSP